MEPKTSNTQLRAVNLGGWYYKSADGGIYRIPKTSLDVWALIDDDGRAVSRSENSVKPALYPEGLAAMLERTTLKAYGRPTFAIADSLEGLRSDK